MEERALANLLDESFRQASAADLRQHVECRWQLLNHDIHVAEHAGDEARVALLTAQLEQLQQLLLYGWNEIPDDAAAELRQWLQWMQNVDLLVL